MNETVTTTETVTFEYDDEGRVIRQVTETVVRPEEPTGTTTRRGGREQ